MQTKALAITISLFTLFSCQFSKSAKKDLVTGLATKGSGLSCEDVYLSNGEEKINRNSFNYGEKVYLNFNNIEGFKKEAEFVFPGMQLLVLNHEGDTVLSNSDLYADYTDGINISPLLLKTNITVASPMHSNNNYTLYVNIWDKKGKGTFSAKLAFNIVLNKNIVLESKNVTYDDIYLFSKERNLVIIDNNAKFNENIYMIFEGLEGFKEVSGKAFIGLGIKAIDAEDNMILNEDDLIGEEGTDYSGIKTQIAPNFIFTGTGIKNPVTCEIIIWDKKSESRIKASVKLNIK